MRLTFSPSRVSGKVCVPPSKSCAIRHILASCLADGESTVRNIGCSDDIKAAVSCMNALGAEVTVSGGDALIKGHAALPLSATEEINTGDSATLLRFLLPLCMNGTGVHKFSLSPQLKARPLSVYSELFSGEGFTFVREGNILSVGGSLRPGNFVFPGNVSSQFAGGLMFALPRLDGDSELIMTGKCGSEGYIDLTSVILCEHGVVTKRQGDRICIRGGQTFRSGNFTVEGDFSAGAMLEALNYTGNDVEIAGLPEKSLQPDVICRELFEKIKAGGAEINIDTCPDLAPILMTAAAVFGGVTLTGTGRLAYKESDRAHTVAAELRKFGADIRVEPDRVTVNDSSLHSPGEVCLSHGDHRVAMALTPLLLRYGGSLDGAEAVNKSFPNFFGLLADIGADIM